MSDTIAPDVAHDNTLAEIARSGFLARYRGATRSLYTGDLQIFYRWCRTLPVDPLQVRRYHLEEFRRHLEEDRHNSPTSVRRRLQTVRSFYRLAVADEMIDRDPTIMLRMPEARREKEPTWTDPGQAARLMEVAEAESPAHHALIGLMCVLAMRVSAACAVRVEDFTTDPSGYRVLHTVGKGGKVSDKPIPVPLLRAIEAAIDGRTSGPLIRRRDGRQQDRNGAYAWVKILARKAGLPDDLHPHSLRHGSITAVIDAGASLFEAQHHGDHADISTTQRYYRRRITLDSHPAHIAARVYAGARSRA